MSHACKSSSADITVYARGSCHHHSSVTYNSHLTAALTDSFSKGKEQGQGHQPAQNNNVTSDA